MIVIRCPKRLRRICEEGVELWQYVPAIRVIRKEPTPNHLSVTYPHGGLEVWEIPENLDQSAMVYPGVHPLIFVRLELPDNYENLVDYNAYFTSQQHSGYTLFKRAVMRPEEVR